MHQIMTMYNFICEKVKLTNKCHYTFALTQCSANVAIAISYWTCILMSVLLECLCNLWRYMFYWSS